MPLIHGDNQHHATLELDLSQYGFPYSLRLYPWQHNLALERCLPDGSTEPLDGSIGFSLEQVAYTPGGPIWLATIPPELVDAIAPYPDLGIYMLHLAANSQRAQEILRSRAIILYLICQRFPLEREMAIALCHFGQREILEQLGYASGKSVLRFLDKIDLVFDNRSNETMLQRLLDPITQRYQYFNHYTTVTKQCLQLEMLLPTLTGSKLAMNLTNTSLRNNIMLPSLLMDTLRLGQDLDQHDTLGRIRSLASMESLAALHDSWTDRRRQYFYSLADVPDRDDPYPILLQGNSEVHIIENYRQLEQEGYEQHHCVGSYHRRIMAGYYLVFRYEGQERATVGIKVNHQNNGNMSFAIDQIKAKKNRLPLDSTRTAIYQWFNHARQEHLHTLKA